MRATADIKFEKCKGRRAGRDRSARTAAPPKCLGEERGRILSTSSTAKNQTPLPRSRGLSPYKTARRRDRSIAEHVSL